MSLALQTAENLSKNTKQYCGFKVGNDFYAVPVLNIQEVIRPLNLTKVPLSEPSISGLINLRGQIVTSISLRELFGLENQYEFGFMNVIVHHQGSLVALMVDEIRDVMDLASEGYEPTPETLDPNIKQFVSGVQKLDNEILILLDLEKIIKNTIDGN